MPVDVAFLLFGSVTFSTQFCTLFGFDAAQLLRSPYTVVTPDSRNPYKQMYVAN